LNGFLIKTAPQQLPGNSAQQHETATLYSNNFHNNNVLQECLATAASINVAQHCPATMSFSSSTVWQHCPVATWRFAANLFKRLYECVQERFFGEFAKVCSRKIKFTFMHFKL